MATIATTDLLHLQRQLAEVADRAPGAPVVHWTGLSKGLHTYLASIRALCEAEFPGTTPPVAGTISVLHSTRQAQAVIDREDAVRLAIRAHAHLRTGSGDMAISMTEICELAGISPAYGDQIAATA